MNKACEFVIVLLASLSALADNANPFPIMISCVNDIAVPTETLIIKANIVTNQATLFYQSDTLAHPYRFSVDKAHGIYSSSSVNIKRNTGGMSGEKSSLTISAHMAEVFRVTRYSNFSVDFAEKGMGDFTPTLLSYSTGVDSFPDSHENGSITLNNLSCVLTGL